MVEQNRLLKYELEKERDDRQRFERNLDSLEKDIAKWKVDKETKHNLAMSELTSQHTDTIRLKDRLLQDKDDKLKELITLHNNSMKQKEKETSRYGILQ